MNFARQRNAENGFTLVEMAVVLTIVALLLSGLLPMISGQVEQSRRNETRKQLDEIQQALIGYAIVNRRLPCPAAPTAVTGTATAGTENCALLTGVLPWAMIGVSETDAWGRRFSYTPTPAFSTAPFVLTTPGTLTIKNASGAGGVNIATGIPAIVISHGPNGLGAWLPSGIQIPTDATHADELDNSDGATPFVSHDNATDFDDIVVWLSPTILFNRMVAAGTLP